MSRTPVLVLVDPSSRRRIRLRERLPAIAVGVALVGVSALPLLLTR